jgi:hypothetical protein
VSFVHLHGRAGPGEASWHDGLNHESVLVEHDGVSIPIDAPIAELVLTLWKAGVGASYRASAAQIEAAAPGSARTRPGRSVR